MFDGGFSGGSGGGHDWNGNGHRDTFDGYMDYKVSGSDKEEGLKGNSLSKGNQDVSWGQVGIIWLAVAVIFIALFLAILVAESVPLIGSAICFGGVFLTIKIINCRRK